MRTSSACLCTSTHSANEQNYLAGVYKGDPMAEYLAFFRLASTACSPISPTRGLLHGRHIGPRRAVDQPIERISGVRRARHRLVQPASHHRPLFIQWCDGAGRETDVMCLKQLAGFTEPRIVIDARCRCRRHFIAEWHDDILAVWREKRFDREARRGRWPIDVTTA